jgi:hypothetical protein
MKCKIRHIMNKDCLSLENTSKTVRVALSPSFVAAL